MRNRNRNVRQRIEPGLRDSRLKRQSKRQIGWLRRRLIGWLRRRLIGWPKKRG
jgi:hypothetical protein